MQVVCPGCRQTLTLPPTTGGMGAMICPLCGAGFMPPSANPLPVNTLPGGSPPYGTYPNGPLGQMGGVSRQILPHQQLAGPDVSHPAPVVPKEPITSPSRIVRSSSKQNPIGLIISIALGGLAGVGIASYLISRTNFVTRVRQDLGVEKTRDQIARERNAFEKSLDDALKAPVPTAVPSERARPNVAPASSGSRENDTPGAKNNKPSFADLAGKSNQSSGEKSNGEMADDPSTEEFPGPPRVTFSDLIDPETGEPRPAPTAPGEQGLASTSSGSSRTGASQRSVALPPLDAKSAIEVLKLGPDDSFAPQHLRLLSSAAQLPAGGEFVVSPTNDDKECVVAYHASPSSAGMEVAVFRAKEKAITFAWMDSNASDEIREQLRNTMVAYTTPTGVRNVALRKSQVVQRAVLDLEKERTEWTWTIEVPPKASEMYIEFGSVANLPHNAEMRGSNEVKAGSRGFISFRDFAGGQLTIGSSFKKGEFAFSLAPEFVERDGDRFSLAQPRLDEFEKSWEDSIARNREKLVQIDAQAAATSALIDRIEGSTAANQAEAAAMIAQKRAAAQKIQGLRTRAASTIKASAQLQARLNGLPKVREAVAKLKDVAMPPFIVYAKVGNYRIDLLEHKP